MINQSFGGRRGAQLAIDMLDKLEGDSDLRERCLVEAPEQVGSPQHNVVRPYIERALAGGSDVLEGFTLILSCFIASATDGTIPDADFYRSRFAWRREIARQHAKDGFRPDGGAVNG